MKQSKKISIIVPVYNVEEYLERCVDSLITQTYHNIEILLIDDGSTDNSFSICNRYAKTDKRVKTISQANNGVAAARNAGLAIATGDYIGFVDPDDYVDKDMYETLYNLCELYHAKLSCCNAYQQGVKKDIFDKDYIQLITSDELFQRVMLECNFALWNKLWHKSLFKQFKFNENIESGSDLSSYLLIFATDRVVYLNDDKYHYTTRQGSLCRISGIENRLGRMRMVDDMVNYIRRNKPHLLSHAIFLRCNTRMGFIKLLLQIKRYDMLQEQLSYMKEDFVKTSNLRSLSSKLKYSVFLMYAYLYKTLLLTENKVPYLH